MTVSFSVAVEQLVTSPESVMGWPTDAGLGEIVTNRFAHGVAVVANAAVLKQAAIKTDRKMMRGTEILTNGRLLFILMMGYS